MYHTRSINRNKSSSLRAKKAFGVMAPLSFLSFQSMDAIPVCTVCKRYKDSAYEQERERKKIIKKPKDRRPIGRPPIGGHKKTKQGL